MYSNRHYYKLPKAINKKGFPAKSGAAGYQRRNDPERMEGLNLAVDIPTNKVFMPDLFL